MQQTMAEEDLKQQAKCAFKCVAFLRSHVAEVGATVCVCCAGQSACRGRMILFPVVRCAQFLSIPQNFVPHRSANALDSGGSSHLAYSRRKLCGAAFVRSAPTIFGLFFPGRK